MKYDRVNFIISGPAMMPDPVLEEIAAAMGQKGTMRALRRTADRLCAQPQLPARRKSH